jgi:hypothetical protein
MSQPSEFVDLVTTFLAAVSSRNQCLLEAFSAVVNALNNRDWNAVADLMDDNVTLTTLNPPVMITTKNNVIPYIRDKIADDKPTLVPLSINVNTTIGQVWGTANWFDNDNGVRTVAIINYWFTFIKHLDGKCYLIYLSGTPDTLPTPL